jgi:hypothetical protein
VLADGLQGYKGKLDTLLIARSDDGEMSEKGEAPF